MHFFSNWNTIVINIHFKEFKRSSNKLALAEKIWQIFLYATHIPSSAAHPTNAHLEPLKETKSKTKP